MCGDGLIGGMFHEFGPVVGYLKLIPKNGESPVPVIAQL